MNYFFLVEFIYRYLRRLRIRSLLRRKMSSENVKRKPLNEIDRTELIMQTLDRFLASNMDIIYGKFLKNKILDMSIKNTKLQNDDGVSETISNVLMIKISDESYQKFIEYIREMKISYEEIDIYNSSALLLNNINNSLKTVVIESPE